MTQEKKKSIRGVGMIEAMVVITIMSVAFAAILSAAVFFMRGGMFATDQVQALFLLDEGVEAVRFLRDEGYTTNIDPLVGSGVFYIEPVTNGWTSTTTNNLILGKYTRTMEVTEVYRRDSDDDIVPVSSGDPKTLDPGTVRLLVTVSWGTSEVESISYITDLYEN